MGVTATSFAQGSLPSPWTLDNPGSGGSSSFPGDRLRISITAGNQHDSIFPGSASDVSVGPVQTIGDVDFDVAVEVGTDLHGLRGRGFAFIIGRSGPAVGIRAGAYTNTGINGGLNNFIAYEYCAYNTAGTVTEASGTNTQITPYFSGGAAWFRLKRATSTWTFYESADGVTWSSLRSWTAAMTVTTLKLGVLNTSPTPAQTFDIFQFVDLSATPDPRPAWVKTTHINTQSTDFAGGTLPSWLTTFTNASGTAVASAGKLRLSHVANTDQSYADVGFNGTTSTDQGLLCKVQAVANANGIPYFDPGVLAHGSEKDQYSAAGGNVYVIEIPFGSGNVTTQRFVRRTGREEPSFYVLPNGFESAYTHILIGPSFTPTLSALWMRIEYADGRFRGRSWIDGGAEPGTWDFDGADRISQGAGVQSLSWAHNDGVSNAGTDAIDVLYVERYDLSVGGDTVPPTDPSNLITTRIGSVDADLSWTGSTDNVAVTGYELVVQGP